jgi:hypothetical protein
VINDLTFFFLCFCSGISCLSNPNDSDSDDSDKQLWVDSRKKKGCEEEDEKKTQKTVASSSTLRLQVSIVKNIFVDINDMIQDKKQIKQSTKNDVAKFAKLLASVDVRQNREDPIYGANELNDNAFEKVVDFHAAMLHHPSPPLSELGRLKEKYTLYMYSFVQSDKTPTTLNELREHLRKESRNHGGSDPEVHQESDMINNQQKFNDATRTEVEMNVSSDIKPVGEENMAPLNEDSFLSFRESEKTPIKLDLDWQHLRNMAQPIVDMQLAKLAMNQNLKNSPFELSLGKIWMDHKMGIDRPCFNKMTGVGEGFDQLEIETHQKGGLKRPPNIEKEIEVETDRKKVKTIIQEVVPCTECGEKPKSGAEHLTIPYYHFLGGLRRSCD